MNLVLISDSFDRNQEPYIHFVDLFHKDYVVMNTDEGVVNYYSFHRNIQFTMERYIKILLMSLKNSGGKLFFFGNNPIDQLKKQLTSAIEMGLNSREACAYLYDYLTNYTNKEDTLQVTYNKEEKCWLFTMEWEDDQYPVSSLQDAYMIIKMIWLASKPIRENAEKKEEKELKEKLEKALEGVAMPLNAESPQNEGNETFNLSDEQI